MLKGICTYVEWKLNVTISFYLLVGAFGIALLRVATEIPALAKEYYWKRKDEKERSTTKGI